ncbi:hypothetical protein [Anaerosolibacter sp.]|uniref:hypothetical protein n=1 Tax=Anaerosolibacter sp. TaxID=1872527 RepID=UPI0039EE90B2
MKNMENHYRSNIIQYLIGWAIYTIYLCWFTIVEPSGYVLAVIAFPFNSIFFFLIVRAYEVRRAGKYIQANYLDLWKKIRHRTHGYEIKIGWAFEKNNEVDDATISRIKRILREIFFLGILAFTTFPLVLVVSTMFE